MKVVSPSSEAKFHLAAAAGYVDVVCEASKRDANKLLPVQADERQLTPTLVAAQCGHLEALRMLVGRGGEPELADAAGSSALHLSAGAGHLSCVSFLVNFGANMWLLDNDLRTAKDVARANQRQEVSLALIN